MNTLDPLRDGNAPVIISGAVLDIATNGPIPGAHVYQGTPGPGAAGAVTDADGVYVFTGYSGALTTISHVSYETEVFDAVPGAQVHYLVPAVYELPTVEITPPAKKGGILAAILVALGIAYTFGD